MNKVILISLRSVEHQRISTPLAVSILEDDLKRDNNKVSIIDMQEIASSIGQTGKTRNEIESLVVKETVHRVNKEDPVMIVISAPIKTINLQDDKNKILEGDKLINHLQSDGLIKKVVIGGSFVTFNYQKIISLYDVICCMGEGEITLQMLVKYLNNEISLTDIKGIAFRGSRVGNQEKAVIYQNRKKLFTLYGSGTPNPENLAWTIEKSGMIWAEASRGCYWGCTFCSVHNTKIKSNYWRGRFVEDVVSGMEKMLQSYLKWSSSNSNFNGLQKELLVLYSDDDFMGNGNVEDVISSSGEIIEESGLKRAEEISKGFRDLEKKYGVKVKWGISTRADAIYRCTEEEYNQSLGKPMSTSVPKWIKIDNNDQKIERQRIWSVLKENGLTSVFLGIDSGSTGQIKRYGKLSSLVSNENAIKICNELEIQLFVGFIVFDPLMSLNDLIENIEFIKNCNIYNSITNPLSSLRITEGTPYKKMAEKEGLLVKLNTDYWTYDAIYINPLVGIINEIMQEWVNDQYSLVYAVKGQAVKDSIDFSRATWWKCLEKFKNFDFELLEELTKLVLNLSSQLSVSEKELRLYTKSQLSQTQKSHIVLDQARKNELEELLVVTKNKSIDIKKNFQDKRYFHVQKFIQQVKLGDIRDVDRIITYHAENLFQKSKLSGSEHL
jgi:radical SAM superfamily enzyme YgiQ (UPF0313 family)